MNNKDEILTYNILVEEFRKQDRLIAEGKMEKPQRIIRDFTPEEEEIVKKGYTLEMFKKDMLEKYGLQ